MDSIVYTRIKELCDEHEITVTKLESELGLGQYSIGRLKNSPNPTVDTIIKIARYFGVSVDYLIGTANIRPPADVLAHDRDFVSLQRAREKMTDIDKSRMMVMLQMGFAHAFEDNPGSLEQNIHNIESQEPQRQTKKTTTRKKRSDAATSRATSTFLSGLAGAGTVIAASMIPGVGAIAPLAAGVVGGVIAANAESEHETEEETDDSENPETKSSKK